MDRRVIWGLVISCMLAAELSPAYGQFEKCLDGSVMKCFTDQAKGATTDEGTRTAQKAEAMASVVTDVASRAAVATEGGTAGTLVDSLAPLFAAFGLGNPESENGNLTAKKSFYLGDDKAWRGTLGATLFADPEIYSPLEMSLKDQLDSSKSGDEISELKSEISEYQNLDLEFQLSYEGDRMGRRWGRRPGAYDELLTAAFLASRPSREPPRDLANHPMAVKTVADVRAAMNSADAEESRSAKEFVGLFDEAVKTEGQALSAAAPLSEKHRKVVADLIANQPQLIVKATYKDREDLVVGPDSLEASFKLEFGMSGNVNDLRSWWRDRPGGCPDPIQVDGAPELSFSCVDTYLAKTKKQPEKGNRLSLTATYSEIDEFRFEIPEESFSFSTPQTEKWTAALSYGRWLSGVSLGSESERSGRARLDLEAKWEDPTDDEMRQERLVATLTLSQKTTACTTLSFGLVWANEPEFLGEVDQDLGARLGFRWDNEKLKDCMGSR